MKLVHVGSVAISFGLFLVRGIWMLQASGRLHLPWVRVLPHVVDTVLLVSAVTLAVMSAQYPFQAPWLTAKVIALVCYIALGMVALRRGSTLTIRGISWAAALLVFGYIVAVALSRDPWPL